MTSHVEPIIIYSRVLEMHLRRGAAAGRLPPPAPPAPLPPAGHAGGDPLLATAVARLNTISKIEEVQRLVPVVTEEMGGARRENTFLRSGTKAKKLADLLDKAPLRLQAPWQQSLIALIDARYPMNDPAWPTGTTEAEKVEATSYLGGFYPEGDGMCGCAEFTTQCPLRCQQPRACARVGLAPHADGGQCHQPPQGGDVPPRQEGSRARMHHSATWAPKFPHPSFGFYDEGGAAAPGGDRDRGAADGPVTGDSIDVLLFHAIETRGLLLRLGKRLGLRV